MKYTDWFNWGYVRDVVRASLLLGILPAVGMGVVEYCYTANLGAAILFALLIYLLLPVSVIVGGAIGFALP